MKTIMTLQKDEKAVQAARDLNMKIYLADRALFDRARDLQTKLGLSGLWKVGDLALANIIKALQAEVENVKEQNAMKLRDRIMGMLETEGYKPDPMIGSEIKLILMNYPTISSIRIRNAEMTKQVKEENVREIANETELEEE